jgi:uncharacterized protein (DUF362 family)
MIPKIDHIESYQETEKIASFVREVLSRQWEAMGWKSPSCASKVVVVKPNWIQESHDKNADEWESLITHPVIIEIVVEELTANMGGTGSIIVCDAPQSNARFAKIIDRGDFGVRLDRLRQRFPQLSLSVLDLRREIFVIRNEVIVDRFANIPDPLGYTQLDLGVDSLFFQHRGEGHYYGADYDRKEVNEHHCGTKHEYLVASTPLNCDLFINLPKLKTHKKTGLTCSLKNLVGINGDKNWLPHHAEGHPGEGGDEFPEARFSYQMESVLKRGMHQMALLVPGFGPRALEITRSLGKKFLGDSERVVRNGNWYGNDTCWRMALDLNRALLYGNLDGTLREAGNTKHFLCIADGIIGGEGDGPTRPSPVKSGVLVAGSNPAEVDATVSKLMGFDPSMIPLIREAFTRHRWPISEKNLEEIEVDDLRLGSGRTPLSKIAPAVPGGFKPHFGWSHLRTD